MRRTSMESAFQAIQIKPGEKLSSLHRRVMRSMEQREKFRKQRKTDKARA
jgi:CHASE3 domain sensor protein